MEVKVQGHRYELKNIKYNGTTTLQFYKDVNINGGAIVVGPSCQEVLRAVIDRVKFLDGQVPWEGNKEIIKHLRLAIALFEGRALIRKVEKGELEIESLPTALDGHLIFQETTDVCVSV
jgi:hypothetical protein